MIIKEKELTLTQKAYQTLDKGHKNDLDGQLIELFSIARNQVARSLAQRFIDEKYSNSYLKLKQRIELFFLNYLQREKGLRITIQGVSEVLAPDEQQKLIQEIKEYLLDKDIERLIKVSFYINLEVRLISEHESFLSDKDFEKIAEEQIKKLDEKTVFSQRLSMNSDRLLIQHEFSTQFPDTYKELSQDRGEIGFFDAMGLITILQIIPVLMVEILKVRGFAEERDVGEINISNPENLKLLEKHFENEYLNYLSSSVDINGRKVSVLKYLIEESRIDLNIKICGENILIWLMKYKPKLVCLALHKSNLMTNEQIDEFIKCGEREWLVDSSNDKEVEEIYKELFDIALTTGQVGAAKKILEVHPEVCQEIKNEKMTLLHFAIKNGYKDAAINLIKTNASVNARSIDWITPLHLAVQKGDIEVTKLLIAFGADINAKDASMRTPLHYAALRGDLDLIKLLLSNSPYLNSEDEYGKTPLYYVRENNEAIILLTESGADTNIKVGTIFFLTYQLNKNMGKSNDQLDENLGILKAIEMDNEESAYSLLEEGNMDVSDEFGESPLHWAARKGLVKFVQRLIDMKVDINKANNFGSTALHIAIKNGRKEMVKLLIDNGADINKPDNKGNTPLSIAFYYGRKAIEELLVENGAQYESEGGVIESLTRMIYTDNPKDKMIKNARRLIHDIEEGNSKEKVDIEKIRKSLNKIEARSSFSRITNYSSDLSELSETIKKLRNIKGTIRRTEKPFCTIL